MSDTKEKILNEALELFSQSGYEAVSVSNIAEKLGITKGALYKHYKNKRDIFDSIVARMYQIDAKRAENYNMPEKTFEDNPEEYNGVSVDSIVDFTLAQFDFWTEDKFASHFRKMLAIEQYHNKEMAELYNNCIVFGPVKYMEDIFAEMLEGKAADNAKAYAIEFYSPLFLLINMSDHESDREKLKNILKKHIKLFITERIQKNEIYQK